MNAVSRKKHYISKVFSVLLLLICFTSVSDVRNTSASEPSLPFVSETSIEPARQHMLDIADLYAHHRWTATPTGTPAP